VHRRGRCGDLCCNAVEHVTYFPGSDEVWATLTETGKVTVTHTVSPSRSGRSPSASMTLGARLAGQGEAPLVLRRDIHLPLCR
jgi:hypothetical protein